MNLGDRVLRTPVWMEAIGAGKEIRLEHLFQDRLQRCLDYSAVGMPILRSFPFALGRTTRRVSLGW